MRVSIAAGAESRQPRHEEWRELVPRRGDWRDELRAAVKAILAEKKVAMTRKELWEALPEAPRVNEATFRELLEAL